MSLMTGSAFNCKTYVSWSIGLNMQGIVLFSVFEYDWNPIFAILVIATVETQNVLLIFDIDMKRLVEYHK